MGRGGGHLAGAMSLSTYVATLADAAAQDGTGPDIIVSLGCGISSASCASW